MCEEPEKLLEITVAKLRAIINDPKLDPYALVVIAKDAEGNGFSPMFNIEIGMYHAETTWYGDFVGQEELDSDPEQFVSDELDRPAICLWSVN